MLFGELAWLGIKFQLPTTCNDRLCIKIPTAGDRVFETGDEKLLELAFTRDGDWNSLFLEAPLVSDIGG